MWPAEKEKHDSKRREFDMYEEEVMELLKAAAVRSMRLDPSALTPETNLKEEFDAKSANFVQIIGELEDEYEVEIDFMKFRDAGTIGAQAVYVANML